MMAAIFRDDNKLIISCMCSTLHSTGTDGNKCNERKVEGWIISSNDVDSAFGLSDNTRWLEITLSRQKVNPASKKKEKKVWVDFLYSPQQ